MTKKCLYLGNLPLDCDETRLRTLVNDAGGAVESVEIPQDRRTGRSRGFAFVEIATEEAAEAALAALKGATLEGRELRVGLAFRDKNEPTGGTFMYDTPLRPTSRRGRRR